MLRYALVLLACVSTLQAAEKKIDFNRDIRPILAGKCFQCHGPDDQARKAGLRLDLRESAVKPLKSGDIALVPGNPQKSTILERVQAKDADTIMPPPKTGKPLTPAEVELLTAWIAQGAGYAQHWAYAKPVRSPLPEVKNKAWVSNAVDAFVLARLEKEGLSPSAVADKFTLARRASIDLTGLPPTPEMVEAFVKDASPNAWEKYVDALLASTAYGERWAQIWLDLARYADSQGFANDPDRTIWRYRDWVIQALNSNKPFDQFSIEQLAGDLLPNATPEQLIATGFHRNTLTNTEGGTSAEEFRSAAVVDRVNTTMQVWQGSTIACAQCHNHKYDPFSQKEYYRLYAIFNSSEDNNSGSDAPTIRVPMIGSEKQLEEARLKLEAAQKKLPEVTAKLDKLQPEWEKSVKPESLPKPIADILAKPADKRTPKEKESLTAHHRSLSEEFKKLDAEVKTLTASQNSLSTTSPVMKEIKPRETTIHIRGDYKAKGEVVTPGLPAVMPPPPEGSPMNRLTLARWLFDENNPLTARVTVNRLWEELFGIGIVETSEEFGMQGEQPSHPELLDFLATEFHRLKWDQKAMLKTLVMSSAYRQTSTVSDELAKRDPYNRLLARGPRFRLSAETVRDQALSAAGILSRKMYGPPIQPPKPNFGLTAAFGGTTDWQPSPGEDRLRRAVYIRQRRNAPYPSLTTFDAPERTFCNVRRIRTNTPLQALVTLNDPCFVEAAQGLARRMLTQGGMTEKSQLEYGFKLALTRPPTEGEMTRLLALTKSAKETYGKDPKKAEAMAIKPLGPLPKEMNPIDAAAFTVVANVILNLDEALARK